MNFALPTYENIHVVSFKNPSQALQQLLRETGPLPSDEERKKKADGGKKKAKFDVEKMADGLVKLNEEDLLQVIQLIHDHKDESTYVQNNIDGTPPLPHEVVRTRIQKDGTDKKATAGEFSVDLYTLPDNLMKLLWDLLVRMPLS